MLAALYITLGLWTLFSSLEIKHHKSNRIQSDGQKTFIINTFRTVYVPIPHEP